MTHAINKPSMPSELSLLAINLTQRCNLACAHCYLDATTLRDGDENELSTAEVRSLLDDIAAMDDGTLVVLTGGEPLTRPDIEPIIQHGSELELAMVLGTNGTLLTKRRVQSLKASGLMGVGISIDSLDPAFHDAFRGQPGSWKKTMNGIENCRSAELSFQLHFSIMDDNANELDNMIEFARLAGARVLNVFFLVCTGRGESFSGISPQRYEQSLAEIINAQAQHPDLIIRPRCAPHYKRVAYQHQPDSVLNRISGREGDGCIAGIHYARVTHDGAVTACPYIETPVGTIRDRSLATIWNETPDFLQLRNPKLNGACGRCEFKELCGGCRARPVAKGNHLMDSDDFCTYVPTGDTVIKPLENLAHTIRWSDEANTRLQRIPRFVRKMVKKRAETYVFELGDTVVTTDHLIQLSANRFGGNLPKRPTS